MAFEAVNFSQKRIRTSGTKEWKLWFSESDEGLAFRCLTKDSSSDCYFTVTGLASLAEGDMPVQESDGDEAFFTKHFHFSDGDGALEIYIEDGGSELVWVKGIGGYGQPGCAFDPAGPLMPELAG